MAKTILFFIIFFFSFTETIAQEFTPTTNLFNSNLDGIWEIPALENILIEKDFNEKNWQEITTTKETFGSIKLNNNTYQLNETITDYLTKNKIKIKYLAPENKYLKLQFKYRCQTSEQDNNFDSPFLLLFLKTKLVIRKDQLDICSKDTNQWGEWQNIEHTYLNNANEIFIFAGDFGDLELPTKIEIKEIKLFIYQEEIPQSTPTIHITPIPKISKTNPQPTTQKNQVQPTPKYHSSNTQPQNGEILGDIMDKNIAPEKRNFFWEKILLISIIAMTFIFSFTSIFVLLLIILKNRKKPY
ncbi:MAG: hypothetical protein COU63_03060 [Candidatus Pacebacteria bacterium CG10_big_fil_rev_8_21_14_0_10_36_11]|nr:hypothetical protein [Candidatus Pacearchaeota archaeon]OIP74406.1 MAG: hypothetical protein AUK08_01310 [Candidatus Pacebacteria bacterium CG2_30_36_39]PIR64968.1 MAG: hypothetical protein COU63_03060 [Candidatus Pacebacteria bacterium CG10_big_fil_rev_8_21_14_0_10_36_11]PJC42503.1 MAG: hypothetical protein CO040_04095 [Candidatus Pacebacteria bacterium CG_4_9_14_0_2_um_filter_36_8]